MPTVRRAGIEDIDEVVSLRMDFIREMKPQMFQAKPELAELTREYVTSRLPAGEFLVWFAEEDGQIIGTSGLVFFHRPPTYETFSELHAYVLNMYTVPGWRGKGVASLLLQHLIEHVRSTPATRITLHATEMGRSVYEKLGFVASNTEMVLSL